MRSLRFALIFLTCELHAVTPEQAPVGFLNLKPGICSGTLLTPIHVVTAAHCVMKSHVSRLTFSLNGDSDLSAQEVKAIAVHVHPGYFEKTGIYEKNDIAVVVLASTDYGVPPKSFPKIGKIESDLAGTGAILVGYGWEPKGRVGRRHSKRVRLSPNLTNDGTVIGSNFFRVMPGPEGDLACRGDSGGPIFKFIAGELVFLGVTSSSSAHEKDMFRANRTSTDRSSKFLCKRNLSTFATAADSVRPWVEAILSGTEGQRVPSSDFRELLRRKRP